MHLLKYIGKGFNPCEHIIRHERDKHTQYYFHVRIKLDQLVHKISWSSLFLITSLALIIVPALIQKGVIPTDLSSDVKNVLSISYPFGGFLLAAGIIYSTIWGVKLFTEKVLGQECCCEYPFQEEKRPLD